MTSRAVVALAVQLPLSLSTADKAAVPVNAAGEYSKHFGALANLSLAVAQSMPAEQYTFRPHPESMNFGQLIFHIATTNYQFCAGLNDAAPPALPSPAEKDGVVKLLGDSFDYCSAVIPNLTDEQLGSPDEKSCSPCTRARRSGTDSIIHPRPR